MIFRLNIGKHYAKGPEGCTCDRCEYDRVNATNPDRGAKGHKYGPGDLVVTDIDLNRFNAGSGPKKFDRLPDNTPIPKAGQKKKTQASASVQSSPKLPMEEDTLQGMSVEELRHLAEQEEIDLGEARRKDKIIEIILEATLVG